MKSMRTIPIIENRCSNKVIGNIIIEEKYEQVLIKTMIEARGLNFEGTIINGKISFLCPTKGET